MTMTYEYGENLYINMTNACPNNCEFCLRNNSSGSLYADNLWYEGAEPTKEEILEDVKSRDFAMYNSIVFCGYGEPTCRLFDLLWLAAEIKKLCDLPLRINTNGLSDLINTCNSAEKMAGLIDIVSISLNGDNAESYDKICHSNYGLLAFPALLDFTKNAVKHIHKVYMTVVSTMPEDEIENCRIICESLGATFRKREYIEE